jgi:hypothetical protein
MLDTAVARDRASPPGCSAAACSTTGEGEPPRRAQDDSASAVFLHLIAWLLAMEIRPLLELLLVWRWKEERGRRGEGDGTRRWRALLHRSCWDWDEM